MQLYEIYWNPAWTNVCGGCSGSIKECVDKTGYPPVSAELCWQAEPVALKCPSQDYFNHKSWRKRTYGSWLICH